MHAPTSSSVRRADRPAKPGAKLAFALAAVALFAATGCSATGQKISEMPGLADVRVLGPKGQKCYDFCAQSQASCKHMCPNSPGGQIGDCPDDCVTDTKFCLADCPELQRPLPPPKN